MLYDINASALLLGCFCKSPSLTQKAKYIMTESDWLCKDVEESEFYSIMYKAIYNLALSGADEIDGVAFDTFIQNHPNGLKVCQAYNYLDYIDEIKKVTNIENIDLYYNIVRKFSMLRAYKQAGFDISSIYDELKDDASQRENLNKYTLAQIADKFIVTQTEIKNKFVYAEDVEHYIVGTDFEYTKAELKKTPNIGLPFQSQCLNEMLNGIQGLTIVSAASGVGKSSMSVGDCCMSGAFQLYDEQQDAFVDNPSYMGNTLFINTEMEVRTELESMFVAFVANVPRQHIMRGQYEEGEEWRVDYAAQMLRDHPIYTVTMPNYTCEMLSEIIDQYVYTHNIKLVCFDYIYTSTSVGNEISKAMQLPAREDLVLQEVSTQLKELSLKHGIPIRTSTQLNRKAQEENGVPDESYIAGSIGIVRKANNFAVIQPITQRIMADLEPYEDIMAQRGTPTHIITVVKGRNSSYPKQSRVLIQMDLGTLRMKDLFVVDRDMQWADDNVPRRTIINPKYQQIGA